MFIGQKIFIMDGHHRYGIAWDYRQGIKEKDGNCSPAKDFHRLSKKEIQPMMVFKDGRYRILTIKKSGDFACTENRKNCSYSSGYTCQIFKNSQFK
jgi:hypothetical protein